MRYIRRWAETQFDLAGTIFKAIAFTGPRQCGKTTLMKKVLPKEGAFVSLDLASNREFANSEPSGFLMQYEKFPCLAIDEVQKAPVLFSEIKAFVDQKPQMRQYLLSGSSNYKAMPTVNESMAGRLGEIRLRPLSEGEIEGKAPRFIDRVLEGNFSFDIEKGSCNRTEILRKAIRGGFPQILDSTQEERTFWFDAYVDALVNQDLLEIKEVRRPAQLRKLLGLCVANSSRLLNVLTLSRNLDLSRLTLNTYLDLLETMFLIERIPAWKPRKGERIGTTPKCLVCDTGLMSHLLGINQERAFTNPYDKAQSDLLGNIMETWVYEQLVSLTDASRDWKLFHFRNHSGIEVDFILENRAGDLIAIEVKASEIVKSEHFKNLRWFKDAFGKTHQVRCVVLYCGSDVRHFAEDAVALPMTALFS